MQHVQCLIKLPCGRSSSLLGQFSLLFNSVVARFFPAVFYYSSINILSQSSFSICRFSHNPTRLAVSELRGAERKQGGKGREHSNNWAHAEQSPLMCFFKGLPKSFSRNVCSGQCNTVCRNAGDFYRDFLLLLL